MLPSSCRAKSDIQRLPVGHRRVRTVNQEMTLVEVSQVKAHTDREDIASGCKCHRLRRPAQNGNNEKEGSIVFRRSAGQMRLPNHIAHGPGNTFH